MATDSPRFGLGRFDSGEAWDHTDLVNHVDEYSIERDTKANRPATGDYDDQLFYATDEEVLYRWLSGSSEWVAVLGAANASIDDTDSTYTTSGESVIYVDTSSGAVTVELATADTVAGKSIKIIDSGENASSNNITIQTEGSQNINPGANSSITLTVDGTYVELESDGSNWFSDRAVEVQSVDSGSVSTDEIQNAFYRVTSDGKMVFESTLSDLISNLSNGDYAFIPSGSYDPITISANDVIIEMPRDTSFDSSDGDAVTLSGLRSQFRGGFLRASGAGNHGIVISGFGATVQGSKLGQTDGLGNHIRVQASDVNIYDLVRQSNAGGDSVVFENGNSGCIIDQYTNAGTITDNDGGNVIGNTT